jgi:tetratricopeptide (TPR) repeat protein
MKPMPVGRAAAACLALSVCLSFSCAPKTRVEAGPAPPDELEKNLSEAQAQFNRGCFVGFKKAVEIYERLYGQRTAKRRVAYPYIRALLLKLIREREVGILSHACYQKGIQVIKENPPLKTFESYFEIAESLSPRTRGIMQDISVVVVKQIYDEVLKKTQADLQSKALADDYHAYLYAAFFTGYALYAEKKDPFAVEILARYPDSVLLKYKNAIYPEENPGRLQALLQAEPDFLEADYNLGELALRSGELLEAEKNFLKALDGLPESPQVTIYLASIYTATEEFDKGLDFFERTLALSPEYRDALLGKAICLSSLGKYVEAVGTLNRIVELGFYMLGESHYWLAWNYHGLKDNDEAQAHIEESKGRLPTNSEVFGLAGTIALEKGQLDRAEKEYLEALRYNGRNTEALFNLGRLYGQRERWPESAKYFETAAFVFEQNEQAFAAKIAEIKASSLSEERKTKLSAKKEQQLKAAQAAKANAFYNAGASYLNSGSKAKALEMATRAADHPQFKERADDLIKKIR